MTELTGARVLITGASSGIGAATARLLAGAGCGLLLAGRDKERLAAVAVATGGEVLCADVATVEGLAACVARCGRIDVLIASAGRGHAGAVAAMEGEQINALVELNLTVPLRLVHAALPGMIDRGRGHVVLLSSIATVGVRDEAVYAATKAGLRAFANGLRHEVAAHGVRVTTVLPGAVDTPFLTARGRPYERAVPRPVPAESVARAVVEAIRRDRAEVFRPRWLTVAARFNGAVPGLFHRLSHRFG